ncbi:MAG: hypothetical protein WCL08_11710, partial [Verrucomicrobiota bacterium]
NRWRSQSIQQGKSHTMRRSMSGAFVLCARQGALTWRWKSSSCPARGRDSRTARVSRATADLEEAEGKALA